MKFRYILLAIIMLILLIILIIPVKNMQKIITANILSEDKSEFINNYTYTKAICNNSNFCQDYEITCRGNETIKTTPITGAFIQHEEDWVDPRDESIQSKLCE